MNQYWFNWQEPHYGNEISRNSLIKLFLPFKVNSIELLAGNFEEERRP
jgi:hypothetical protein